MAMEMVPIESKQQIYVDFVARLRLQKRLLQDLKKNSSLNSNDMISTLKRTAILFIPAGLMFAWRTWGIFIAWDGQSTNALKGKLPIILSPRFNVHTFVVLRYFQEMLAKLGQFSGTPVINIMKLIVGFSEWQQWGNRPTQLLSACNSRFRKFCSN